MNDEKIQEALDKALTEVIKILAPTCVVEDATPEMAAEFINLCETHLLRELNNVVEGRDLHELNDELRALAERLQWGKR